MLIGISGKARAGKNTFGDFLVSAFEKKLGEKYITVAYADVLKKKLMLEFDLSYEQLYGELKEVPDKRYVKKDGSLWTPREIMQFVGTDCYRSVDDNFWVKSLFNNLKETDVIITDCRFKSEVDAVIDRGGYHIRVQRYDNVFVNGKEHISETELDEEYNVDFLITNTTMEKLKTTADDTVDLLNELDNNIRRL